MRIRLCAALSLGMILPSFAVAQPSGPVTWADNGHTYMLTSRSGSWSQAEAEAMSLGGSLVSINSAQEQAFLNATFLVDTLAARPVWIGMIRSVLPNGSPSNAPFIWADGSDVTYTNWQSGEPNNSTANNQPMGEWVATMNWHKAQFGAATGTWNDTPDDGTFGYGGTTDGGYYGVIELVPTPGSLALLGLGGIVIGRRRR